jgi:hypothetical protein
MLNAQPHGLVPETRNPPLTEILSGWKRRHRRFIDKELSIGHQSDREAVVILQTITT